MAEKAWSCNNEVKLRWLPDFIGSMRLLVLRLSPLLIVELSMSALPPSFLFNYSIEAHQAANLPKKQGKSLLGLAKKYELPDLSAMDGRPSFAQVFVAWNEKGLGLSIKVKGKKKGLKCNAKKFDDFDSCQMWIDTRDTKNVHRATRFCHHFVLLPSGEKADDQQPTAFQNPISNAREASPVADSDIILVQSQIESDGYLLESWFPKEVLNGFDPQSSSKIGFYYLIKDQELGEQSISVGSEFPIRYDPSLWVTLELKK